MFEVYILKKKNLKKQVSNEMNEEELAIFGLVAFISNKAEGNNSQCQGFHQETPVKASCTGAPCQTRVALLSTNYKDAM